MKGCGECKFYAFSILGRLSLYLTDETRFETVALPKCYLISFVAHFTDLHLVSFILWKLLVSAVFTCHGICVSGENM